MKTASTDTTHRKYGICASLINHTLTYMKEKHVSHILGSALKRPDGYVVVGGLLDATGYERLMELKKPWNDIDCLCPHCHKQFCECDSVIYIRNLYYEL